VEEIHLSISGKHYGPYDLETIRSWVARGELDTENTAAWHEGAEDWANVNDVLLGHRINRYSRVVQRSAHGRVSARLYEPTAKHQPLEVSRAVALLWTSLAVGLLRSVWNISFNSQGSATGLAIFWFVFFGILHFFLILKVAHGRNWARVTYVVLFALGIPFVAFGLVESFQDSPLLAFIWIALFSMQLVAIFLLFMPKSSAWYRKMKS
jgi:hypothetical protein